MKKRFLYNGYLQIAEVDAANATETVAPVLRKTYLWDPLEPIATRILAMNLFDETGTYQEDLYYTHDSLKNTTALFGIKAGRRALYEYGPYGNIVKMEGDAAEFNLFRFSSEYFDEETRLVQYNFRYYNPTDGRWLSRDPLDETAPWNRYGFVRNMPLIYIDMLGKKENEPKKFCFRTVIMTHYGDLSSDQVGTRDNILQPGDIAVGHFGKKQFPKHSDKWALPFGTQLIVWPQGESSFVGTVSDVGAFDKKHPKKAGPRDWIDIWDPEKSRRNITTKGVIIIEVPYCEPCPPSFSELTMDMVPDYRYYA